MPEGGEVLMHYLHVRKAFLECIVPTGTRVQRLWYDMNEKEEALENISRSQTSSFQRDGLVGELREKYHVERMKASLWPSHVNPLELSLEDVDYNCRSLFLKFRGLDGEQTWMGVSRISTHAVPSLLHLLLMSL